MTRLAEGNDIYRLMVECISEAAIFMLDADGRILTWNAGAERIKGFTREQALGRHFSIFYSRDEVRSGKPERLLLAAVAQGRVQDEGWRMRKDGTRFWADVDITAVRDKDGTLLGFVNNVRDLTDPKSAKDELWRSEQRFHSAIEASPIAMITVNRSGRIEMLNLQAEVTFGYARDELLDQPAEILIPERFRKGHRQHRMSFFANPKARPMDGRRDLYALKKDGTEIPVEIGLSPIETQDGLVVLASVIDISERKWKEEQLRSSAERFRQLVEGAPNALLMVASDGRIEMLNFEAEQLFGYAREELTGAPVEILVPERFRGHHPALRASFVADPSTRQMGIGRNLYGLRKDGSEFPVEIALNPIENHVGIKVVVAITDLTVRKRMEEQIATALKEKEALLSEVHHRVRNTLQITQSMLSLQSAKVQDPSTLEIFMDCQSRIRCMALIHQTAYQSNNFANVDMAGFLNSLALALLNVYRADPNRVTLSIDARQVRLPIGVAISLGQIANELFGNALRHAFPDGRHGSVSIALAKDAKGDVTFSVSDDGVGIPESVDVTHPKTLGLHLVKLLADQLRWPLSV